jgi:hypothetical protein
MFIKAEANHRAARVMDINDDNDDDEEEEVIQDEQRQGDVLNCDAHNTVASFVPFDSYDLCFYRASKQYMQTLDSVTPNALLLPWPWQGRAR